MKVGFTNGCFDTFHDGHRHFLTECRKHCSYLIVAVNTDDYCHQVKGEDRPYDPLERRMMHVRGLAEAVIPFLGREENLVMEIRPDVIFKGGDHSPDQTHFAARQPGWKDMSTPHGWPPMWVCPIVHIARLPDISTTIEAERRSHAPQRDAPARP